MPYFMTEGPAKEHGTDKPSNGRVKVREKGDTMCPLTSQNSSHWHPSCWAIHAPTGRTLSQNDGTEKAINHVTEQSSQFPLPTALHLGTFPNKTSCVSPQTIHFRVLDNSPIRTLEGVPLSATENRINRAILYLHWFYTKFVLPLSC